ncbi:hypothetical protein E0H22_17750 [Rhodopseudomonas boonkerdii]|uniref:DUF6886 family protein n=1 Tax=Rhodopseudomonas boonkerdii TaxID=475937 RepID=UPI001E5343F0|nr:DUF6886 family protein [Rhodopseudomonas boonkerdii]UGV27364.1 hypothetical protein E0H22_17750 [Rhodopseudomonas boonkerdii]
MRLFHFSDRNDIEVFMPLPVETPVQRPHEQEWLNGPLVWAIDDWHQAMYLFPRDCPRVLVWPVETTTPEYLAAYKKMTSCRMVAHIELGWLDRLSHATIYRYEFAADGFKSLDDAGMWVSPSPMMPVNVERIDNMEKALSDAGVELRVLPSLTTLEPLWETSLHVSGIGLSRAKDRPITLPRPVN